MYLEKKEYLPSIVSEWPTEFEEMNFVSKLLLLTLEKEADEITIVPREFIYGAGGTVKTTDSLKVSNELLIQRSRTLVLFSADLSDDQSSILA